MVGKHGLALTHKNSYFLKLHCQCFGLRIGRDATKFEFSLAATTMGTKIKYGHPDCEAIRK
jgi:hypothetical protein